jgi:hypothetical protein
MKLDLAAKCTGLEEKIAKWEMDLQTPQDQDLADEQMQYEIYTLLPELLEKWDKLQFSERLLFVNALVRKVIIRHPAPSWLIMEIHWKRADWGIDVTYNIPRKLPTTTRWSDEDDGLLMHLYPTSPTMEILQQFPDRTWGSIKSHAMRLGIQRRIKEPTGIAYNCRTLRDIAYEEEHGIMSEGNAIQWSAQLW